MKSSDETRLILEHLFEATFKSRCISFEALPQGGGNRIYYRMKDNKGMSAIGVRGNDIWENDAFIYLAKCLRENGINVPEVYSVSEDKHYYLQQDLGDISLFSILHTTEGDKYLEQAVKDLPKIQLIKNIDLNKPFLQSPFSARGVMADLNYFKYCFLKPCDIDFDEERLQDDFEQLCEEIMSSTKNLLGLMYRDCQSRNIMIHKGKVWWIDFQSARKGPILYDIVSLLWQAKAGLSEEKRMSLINIYFDTLKSLSNHPLNDIRYKASLLALLRTLQVLGAYGFRGLVQRKAHFITSIPSALSNLKLLLENNVCDKYPYMKEVLLRLCDKREDFMSENNSDKLLVEVFSFSYKKGYPRDYSGNGGGFMFDCRAMHNPGRYKEYKTLTGMDDEVIEFLEERGEVQSFLSDAQSLVDKAVERYVSRGFTHLQIGFGCTGGQHRSVYCAEQMAKHLHESFGDKIIVSLRHREQSVSKRF